MKKSIAKNYIYNLIYQIMIMIIPLITTPYLSRVLGAENIGIYGYSISIVTYFILFGSLGLSLYGQREIAYVQNDKKRRSLLFIEIFIIKSITMIISLMLFYFLFCLNGEYSYFFKILIFEIIANIIDISWFFQGLEEFKKIIIRSVIIRLISVICIFVFVKSSNDLDIYFYIYTLSSLFGNFSLFLYLPEYLVPIKLKDLCVGRHFLPALNLFIPQIAIQIYTVLDKTMLGVMLDGKAEVGYYEQAIKLVKLLMTLATSLGTVMMPRIAYIYANGNIDELKKYIKKSFSVILLLAFPLMFGIISISKNFVPLFYGAGYDKVILLIIILSPLIIIIGISNIIGNQYLLPTKQQKKYTFSVLVGAVVNFLLNIILINKLMSFGAAISTIIAESCVTITQFLLVKEFIRFGDIIKLSYKYFICSLIMLFSSLVIAFVFPSCLYTLIAQIFVSIFIYFLCLIIMKDSIVMDELALLKNSNLFKKIWRKNNEKND